MGKIITQLENDIDIGCRATEMCPNIKAIDISLSELENLYILFAYGNVHHTTINEVEAAIFAYRFEVLAPDWC